MRSRVYGFLTVAALFPGLAAAQDGAVLYQQHCAVCHDAGSDRAPSHEALRAMTADRVLAAMETGPMVPMAIRRTAAERRMIAEFVTGKTLGRQLETAPRAEAMCANQAADFSSGPVWVGWGANLSNTRFQDAGVAGLTAAQVPRLQLKWAFGFPGELTANAQPAIAGGRVFVGSPNGKVYSLDANTGCIHWYFEAGGGVRSAPTIHHTGDDYTVFFADGRASVYAVKAATGKLVWKTKVDDFPSAGITSSPVVSNGRLYIGVRSGEEATAALPDYECCRFRGSVVALDAATGNKVWKTYMIPEEAKPTKKNKADTQLWGPSGADVWSSPAVDERQKVLYVTTGNNFSLPATRTSDAFVALDLDSGKILWSRQMTEGDVWVTACRLPDKTNCPDLKSPDFDFASSPILVNLPNGRHALVAGQKSGIVHAIDPDQQGKVLWQVRVGKGGTIGGVQWGSAVDGQNIYVAVSDIGRIVLTEGAQTDADYSRQTDPDPKQGGGMYALRVTDGEKVWYTPPAGCGTRPRCSPAQSAAVTAIPGVAFSGSVDGHLRAYAMADGKVIWDFDTERTHQTVNGVEGRGGSIDGAGPAIAGGMLFVNSGYAMHGGAPGNVLLAFSVDGK